MTRVPLSKSMPKLSCFVATASDPMIRIVPDMAKNHRLFPMKSNFHS